MQFLLSKISLIFIFLIFSLFIRSMWSALLKKKQVGSNNFNFAGMGNGNVAQHSRELEERRTKTGHIHVFTFKEKKSFLLFFLLHFNAQPTTNRLSISKILLLHIHLCCCPHNVHDIRK